jgi:L-asparaginase
MRAVTVLAMGGTIAMSGERATPTLDVGALVKLALGPENAPELELRDIMNLPGSHVGAPEALAIAREACATARSGRGVVVTTGTDTMEELAMLTDLVHEGEEPIVFTGANRPASHRGADGPANLADAVAVAGAGSCAGLGAVIVFGGEIHAARLATKVDTTGPAAFGSPQAGPLGRVIEGTPWLSARPLRQPPTVPDHLDARVDIVTAYLGADGRALDEAARTCDGLVAVLLGAGHAPPAFMPALARAGMVLPVVITTRVARGGLLHDTYGFPGAERDVRATGAVPAGLLSPAAARVKLQACLGAGLDVPGIAEAFAGDDASPGRAGSASTGEP